MRWVQCVTGVVLVSALAGCGRDEAKVYHVQKDDSQPAQATSAPASDMAAPDTAPPPTQPMALPLLKYQLPEGWQEKPASQMRVASFSAAGPKGQSADVSDIPMPIIGRD